MSVHREERPAYSILNSPSPHDSFMTLPAASSSATYLYTDDDLSSPPRSSFYVPPRQEFSGSDDGFDSFSNASLTPTATTPLLPKASLKGNSANSSPTYSSRDSIATAVDPTDIVPTPLPMRQLTVLLIGQIPEPVIASVLYPFINQVRHPPRTCSPHSEAHTTLS